MRIIYNDISKQVERWLPVHENEMIDSVGSPRWEVDEWCRYGYRYLGRFLLPTEVNLPGYWHKLVKEYPWSHHID